MRGQLAPLAPAWGAAERTVLSDLGRSLAPDTPLMSLLSLACSPTAVSLRVSSHNHWAGSTLQCNEAAGSPGTMY